MTEHDDHLAADDMSERFTEQERDTFDELEGTLRLRARPVAARVRVDGEDTTIVLGEHLGGFEQEAALEALWRCRLREHGGEGPAPPAA